MTLNGFHAGEVALEIGARARPVVEAIRRHDAELADQIYRAAKSLALNAPEAVVPHCLLWRDGHEKRGVWAR